MSSMGSSSNRAAPVRARKLGVVLSAAVATGAAAVFASCSGGQQNQNDGIGGDDGGGHDVTTRDVTHVDSTTYDAPAE